MPVKAALHSLLHLFFPHNCAGCGSDILSKQQLLCLHCLDKLPVTNFHYYADNPVEKIFIGRLPLLHAASYLYFSKGSLPQRLVHQLKYKNNQAIGYFMGRRMGEALLAANRFRSVDALVPMPLFAARERKRGYNQATILCKGMAEPMQLPVLENIISRPTATATQTRKNRAERWQNIAGKFKVEQPDMIRGKHLLLVDDVVTTGATLEACGMELMATEQVQLSIITMAYASNN